jgi:hypothetical protein
MKMVSMRCYAVLRTAVIVLAVSAVCIPGCSKSPEQISSADVENLEDVCVSNARRASSRSDCIVEAFCRCAASDYQTRTKDRAEYRTIMSGIHDYIDRSGYYCANRAESACPSERKEEEEEEEEEQKDDADRPVYIPPGPAQGLPVGIADAFTLGSPRSLVERIQGKPTSIDRILGETWWYGGSNVQFQNGKVHEWTTGTVPLHVTLAPKDQKRFEDAKARGKFTVGDTRDDVLGVHGVPTGLDQLMGETWWYKGSHVEFSAGKVRSWSSVHYAALSVYLEPKDLALANAARERGSYGKGAKKDEVLAIEGVPTSIDLLMGETWWYGASRVEFSGGRVAGWDSYPMNPLKAATGTK